MKKTILAFAAAVAGLAFGTTRYVDCNLEDYTNHDGSSWAMAYKTIQEGVDSADPDDVVLVAPGWYDEGGETAGSDDLYLTNRVYISKRITVRSRDGRASRDSTFIVGRHATVPEDPAGMGLGQDAIRCVRFQYNNSTHGAVVEGFTLVNGATRYNNGVYHRCSVGGGADFGARTSGTSDASYLVDCVISNCVATRGGGMYFGNAVRCLFTGNHAGSNAPAARDANLYWCILDGNWGSAGIAYLGGTKAINCTIVNSSNSGALRGNSTDTRCIGGNCAILQHGAGSCVYITLTNCVVAANITYCFNGSTAETRTNSCRLVGMDSCQFASTATGDLRPLSTGDLIGAGSAAMLDLVPERYRYTDYDGNAVDPAKPIHAGAIQTPVTPVGGIVRFTDFGFKQQNTAGLRVNGHLMCIDHLYSTGIRKIEPLRLECLMPLNPDKIALRRFFGFSANQDGTFTVYHFPLRGTTASYVMAPPAGSVLTVTPVITENVLWTDPSVADGAEMDGTEEHPYNTLQAAADRAMETKGFWCIYAKKGRYDKGGALYQGITNRVAFTDNKTYISLYSVDGPEETFIVGAESPGSTHPYGYGDGAMRCVAALSGCATVNGFTLTGGRCALNNGSEVNGFAGGYGAAVFSVNSPFTVADCIITNCAASRGAVSYAATLHRCRIIDCTTTYMGALRNGAHASSCLFVNTRTARTDSSDFVLNGGDGGFSYNCTLISGGDNPGTTLIPVSNASVSGGGGVYNTLAYGFQRISHVPNTLLAGCWHDEIVAVDTSAQTREGFSHAKMAFADPAAGDYALYSAAIPTKGGTSDIGGMFWAYGTPVDIEGNEFEYGDEVIAGAYRRTVPSIAVCAAASSDPVATVTPSGDTFLTADSPSVTFTAAGAATRNFQGFYLDGELATTATSYTYTYDGTLADGTRLALDVRYVPHWYVDPTKSDANSGCDWENAKRTLAGVMAKALPGDTVFAAPGVYAEGDMIQHTNSYARSTPAILRARVVLTNDVTLVSRDGPETTVIMGATSPQNLRGYGLGADALRCAYLYPNASIDGFTLSGGRGAGGTPYDDNNFGVGATGWYDSSGVYPTIRNCIVTNCIAERGAGITHARAVNCRFFDCRALNNSAAGIHSRFVNCFFDYNQPSWVVGYWTELRSCTFGAHNNTDTVLGTSPRSGNVQTPCVYNTLMLAGRCSTGANVAFTNCAFSTDMQASITAASSQVTTNGACICVEAGKLQTDADGVPVIGANLAIDAGDTNWLNLAEFPVDIAGRPRAVNGARMDIGCHEVDWKPRYGEDLGPRVTVTDATPAVCETAERTVELTDGTALSFAISNPKGLKARQQVQLRVSGAGVLTLSIGGETRTFTDTGAVQTCEFVSTAASTALDFSFAGPGSAELVSAIFNAGTAMFFR